jgi:preprotein translocase subunit SecA
MIGAPARKLFGSAKDRRIESRQPRVDAVNALESELATLSDDELRARTNEFKRQLGTPPKSPRSRTNFQ